MPENLWKLSVTYLFGDTDFPIGGLQHRSYIYTLSKLFRFLAMKYQFLIQNRVVFRTVAVSYVKGTVSQKNEFQIISYVHSSRKHWKCKYINIYFMV